MWATWRSTDCTTRRNFELGDFWAEYGKCLPELLRQALPELDKVPPELDEVLADIENLLDL